MWYMQKGNSGPDLHCVHSEPETLVLMSSWVVRYTHTHARTHARTRRHRVRERDLWILLNHDIRDSIKSLGTVLQLGLIHISKSRIDSHTYGWVDWQRDLLTWWLLGAVCSHSKSSHVHSTHRAFIEMVHCKPKQTQLAQDLHRVGWNAKVNCSHINL